MINHRFPSPSSGFCAFDALITDTALGLMPDNTNTDNDGGGGRNQPQSIARLYRIINITQHLDLASTASYPAAASTPVRVTASGLVYLDVTPFEGTLFHSLLNRLNTSMLTWDRIIPEALFNGKLDFFFRSKKPTEEDTRTFEAVLLALLVALCNAGTNCNSQAIASLFRDVLDRTRKKELGIMKSSRLPPEAWYRALIERSCRFTLYFQDTARKIPSPASNFWTNRLEASRMEGLQVQGLIRLSDQARASLGKQQLKKLGDVLSLSYRSFLEFTQISILESAGINLEVLSEYAPQLPISWFTQTLLTHVMEFLERVSKGEGDGKTPLAFGKPHVNALKLFAVWARKSDSYPNENWVENIFTLVDSWVHSFVLSDKLQGGLFDGAVTGALQFLSAASAKREKLRDLTVEVTLSLLSKQHATHVSSEANDAIMTSAANLMTRVTSLGQLASLSKALIHTTNTTTSPANSSSPKPPPRSTTTTSSSSSITTQTHALLEHFLKQVLLYEHVSGTRWDNMTKSLPLPPELQPSRVQVMLENAAWAVQPWRWWEARREVKVEVVPVWLGVLVGEDDDEARGEREMVKEGISVGARTGRLALLVGCLRGLFARRSGLEKNTGNLGTVVSVGESLLQRIKDRLRHEATYLLTEGTNDFYDIVTYSLSQLLVTMNPISFQKCFDYEGFAKMLQFGTRTLLWSEECLAPHAQVYLDSIKARYSGPSLLRDEVSRISKYLGIVGAILWADGNGSSVIEASLEMVKFSKKLFEIWAGSGLSESVESDAAKAERAKRIDNFKLALFAVVMFFKHLLETIVDLPPDYVEPFEDEWTATAGAEIIILHNCAFALYHLHFITYRFGPDGFSAWREVMDACTERLREVLAGVELSEIRLLPEWKISSVDELLATLKPKSIIPEQMSVSILEKTNLLYWLQLAHRLVVALPEATLSTHILPFSSPYLTFHQPKPKESWKPTNLDLDLFDISHELHLSVFQHVRLFKSLAKSLAPVYADLLLKHYPEPIEFQLVRRSFSYMIKSLSSLSTPRTKIFVADSSSGDEEFAVDKEAGGGGSPIDGSDRFGIDSSATEMVLVEDRGNDASRTRIGSGTDDDSFEESEKVSVQEEDWSGDEAAWKCILLLVENVEGLGKAIMMGTASRNERHVSSSASPTNGTGGRSLPKRLKEIMDAAPIEVQSRIRQTELMHVLFDQIRTISLRQLQPLLDTVRSLMLFGTQESTHADEEVLRNADQAGIQWITGYLSKSQAVMTSSELAEWRKSRVGPGVEADQEGSEIWKALLSSVGYSRGFDQLRRVGCIKWYLQLKRDASSLRAKLNIARETNSSNGNKAGEGVEGNNGLSDPKHPLRAKL